MGKSYVEVLLFEQMDDSLLDVYLWAMKAYSNVEGAFIVHEGDPMNEVLFIIRGHLEKCDNNWWLVLVFSMLGL